MFVSILEDDLFIAEQMAIYFEGRGAQVEHFTDGEEMLESGNLPHFDIFLLDVDTPRLNGLEALCYLREIGIQTPAIFVTAKSHLDDVKLGYGCGCNDYVKKPFDIEELELRMRMLLPKNHRIAQLNARMHYDLDARTLVCEGQTVVLGQTEQMLLEMLIRNRDRTIPVEDLREWVWQGKEVSDATIRSFMRLLRNKVGGDAIRNHRGVGYSIQLYALK